MTGKVFSRPLEDFRFLVLTPSWGSKRRREQQAYEERLDEAMERRGYFKDVRIIKVINNGYSTD